jgi:hypothetical protein
LSLATIQFSQITEANRAKTSSLDARRSYFGPVEALRQMAGRVLVEPPGTAPGSDTVITRAIYRHIPPKRAGLI